MVRGIVRATLVAAAFSWGGCDTSTIKDDRTDAQVAGQAERIDVSIGRLDRALFNAPFDSLPFAIASARQRYGGYTDVYFINILRIGDPALASFPSQLRLFLTDIDMRKLYDDAQRTFGDMAPQQAILSDALNRYHRIWPDSIVPQVVADISGLNYGIVVTDSAIGIGLDMFLAHDYPMYPALGIPQYMMRQMVPHQLAPQAINAWVGSMYETTLPQNDMLARMVFHGKVLLAADTLMPDLPDSALIGFLNDQMAWCEASEGRVWRHMVENSLLFSTDEMLITKWTEPAPFVPGIPRESPGRLGRWVGWQMVRAYADRHPELSLKDIMVTEAKVILSDSGYRPKD
jgi:hypothetical protein